MEILRNKKVKARPKVATAYLLFFFHVYLDTQHAVRDLDEDLVLPALWELIYFYYNEIEIFCNRCDSETIQSRDDDRPIPLKTFRKYFVHLLTIRYIFEGIIPFIGGVFNQFMRGEWTRAQYKPTQQCLHNLIRMGSWFRAKLPKKKLNLM